MSKITITLNLLKKQKGSIVAVLVASLLLGISTVALLGHMENVSEQTESVTQKHGISFDIHTGILNNLRGLLIETKLDQNGNKQNQNRWGVCSLIKPPGKTHGVDLVKISLSSNLIGVAANSFSEQRWKQFFSLSEYELLSNDSPCKTLDSTFQSSVFSRCFKYIGKTSDTAVEIYVIARIVPKKFPKFNKIDLSSNTELDSKLVVFELQTIIGTNKEEVSPLKYYTMAWSNDIVECEMQVRGTWINVQLAGTGTGRLSNRLVINNPFFVQNIQSCSEVEFQEIPSDILMGGHILTDGSIAADHSQSKKLACRKKLYRCPGEAGFDTDYFDQINFQMHIGNNYGGLLRFNSLNLTLLNQQGKEIDSVEDGKISSLTANVNRVNDNFQANTSLNPEIELQPGTNIFSFSLTDKNPGSLVSLCRQACSGSKYYPSISMEFSHSPSTQNCDYSRKYTEDPYRIACNVCHSKMCHKIGLGTFGPIRDDGSLQGLVDEPLDGVLPECALKKTTISYDLPSVSSGTGDCVAMKVNGVNSFKNFKTNQYEFQNCSNSLPVLCFAYGHYLPALSLSAPTTAPSIFTGTFADAQEACYNMGKEIIDKNKLAEYFKRFWPNISVTTNASVISALTNLGLSSFDANHFQYINNASRGIFINPFYNISTLSNRLKNGSTSYLQKFLSSYNKIWVSIEKDGDSQLVGSIPQATTTTSSFSLFTRKEFPSRSLILNDTNNISDSDTDTVLTHNIRYKGVYNTSRSGSHPVLCRRGSGDFILANTHTTLVKAPQTCRNQSAYFIPPLSATEWAKAMVLLNNNDEMYAFPNPGDFSGENYSHSRSIASPTAWVALSKKGSTSFAKDWRLSSIHFSNASGAAIPSSLFITETIPTYGPNYMGVIDHQGKPVMLSKNSASTLNLNNYKKACFTDKGNQQVKLESSVKADQSCGSGKTALNEGNLKLNSIKFASEWVQKYSSGNFILNESLVQESKTQAQKSKCRGSCSTDRSDCHNQCSDDNNSCRSGCTTTTYNSVLKKWVTTTNAVCMSNCASSQASCDNSCTNDEQTCNNSCDSTHDTTGHAYIWFN